MKEVAERLRQAAVHLSALDELCEATDTEYRELKAKLASVPGYEDIARQMYHGQKGRQMKLGDLLLYALTGRGYWSATASERQFSSFIAIVMRVVNLLFVHESILSSRVAARRQVLEGLTQKQIESFFADAQEKQLYEELQAAAGLIQPDDRRLYPVMDSIAPRSIGAAIELLVYVYLLKRGIGYIVPLLFTQRLFLGRHAIAPPDYLLLRPGGEVIGIEVGGGIGRFSLTQGKIDQINAFVQGTSLPVVTAIVFNYYRCPTCQGWITYCDEVVERTSLEWAGTERYVACPGCPRYEGGKCPDIVYRGRLKPGDDERHFHYRHEEVRDNTYVARALAGPQPTVPRLLHYFPYVQGLEQFSPIAPP